METFARRGTHLVNTWRNKGIKGCREKSLVLQARPAKRRFGDDRSKWMPLRESEGRNPDIKKLIRHPGLMI